jgi:hypothetical protein
MVSYSIVELVESSTRSKFRKKEEKKPAQCKKKGAPLCFNNFYSFLCLFAFSFKLFSKFSVFVFFFLRRRSCQRLFLLFFGTTMPRAAAEAGPSRTTFQNKGQNINILSAALLSE